MMLLVGASLTPVCESKLNKTGSEASIHLDSPGRLSLGNLSWEWAVSGGGTGQEDCWGLCADNDGNTYVTGTFEGTASFGSISLTSTGGTDVFVAKLDANGAWQWAVSGGGSGSDLGQRIAIDSGGNLCVIGSFEGTAEFGSFPLTSSGGPDVFVAKLDNTGAWQWAAQGGGPDLYDMTSSGGICVDTSNNVYITGYFMGDATFGSITLTTVAICDAFVAKLSTGGTWQWAVQSQASGTGGTFGASITSDASKNTYLTGYFTGSTVFGTTTLICNGLIDAFIAKLSPTGSWQWAVQSETEGYGLVTTLDICIDANRSTYITGGFYQAADFGSTTLTSNGGFDVFVAKLSSDAVWQWAASAGGVGSDSGGGIRTDSTGCINITGTFEGTAYFGSKTLISNGGMDVFIAKLSSNGGWQWEVKGGGPGNDLGRCIGADSESNYVAGQFSGTATFGGTQLVSNGGSDVFVAKFSGDRVNLPPVLGTPSPTNGSSGTPLTVTWSIPINDPEGDQISWTIECSNGQTNGGTGAANGTRTLVISGLAYAATYTVWVNATDPLDSDLTTRGWFRFTTKENQPPSPPVITGPTQVKAKVAVAYNFTATDPDSDDLSYFIDWGDGTNSSWIGPYHSGELITQSHTWATKGTYAIKAKVKDTSGAESDWGTFNLKVPLLDQQPHFRFLIWLLERFPHAFPILRQIIKN